MSVDNSNAAVYFHTSAGTLAQHGRVAGYLTILGSRDPSHAFALEDGVDRYRSVAGAHWVYSGNLSLHGAPAHTQHLATTGIGDESSGYTEFGRGGGVAAVYLRRGHYWARVFVTVFSTVPAGDILRLARTIDGRLKHAG
jgi:hypothetical protein